MMAESKTWSNTASGSYTQNRDSMRWTSTSKKNNSIASCCRNYSSSSDEEDQEEIQRLKEAAISIELHTEDARNATPSINNQNNTEQAKQPSLRQNQHDKTDYNQLQTTPSFQTHIAKKLSRILDAELEFSVRNSTRDDLCSSSDTGIKLLSTSKEFVKLHEVVSVKKRPLKKSHDSSSSNSDSSCDEDAEFAEAAISYDAIKLKDQLLSAFDASIEKTEETPKLGNTAKDSKTKQKTKKKRKENEKR